MNFDVCVKFVSTRGIFFYAKIANIHGVFPLIMIDRGKSRCEITWSN